MNEHLPTTPRPHEGIGVDGMMNDPITNMNRNFQQIMDKMNAKVQFLVSLLDNEQYQEYEKWIEGEWNE